MANNFTNFGVASVEVKILDELPYIDVNPRYYQFDIGAYGIPTTGGNVPPLFIESINNEDNTFSAIIPSRRKLFVDNYIDNAFGSYIDPKDSSSKIIWKPTGCFPDGLQKRLADFYESYGEHPDDPTLYLNPSYKGPVWDDLDQEKIPTPNDEAVISLYFKSLTQELSEEETESINNTTIISAPIKWIWQKKMGWGLTWSVLSQEFLSENQPFWVNVKKYASPTSTNDKLSSFFCVSIGFDDPENRFDLILSENAKPLLVDYIPDKAGNPIIHEFSDENARLTGDEEEYEIGFMVVAGRLVIFVNQSVLIYERAVIAPASGTGDSQKSSIEGSLLPCKISKGRVQISGSNYSCYVNACPMTFAPLGAFAIDIPEIIDGDGKEEQKGQWKGVGTNGKPRGSVAELPGAGTTEETIFGVDCKKFSGDLGSCSPKGKYFLKKGTIKAVEVGIGDSKNKDAAKMTFILMQPQDLASDYDESTIPLAGCPYYFRLKGIWTKPPKPPPAPGLDISNDVISVSESFSSNDWHHISKQCTVTVYNNNGQYNLFLYGQKGISLKWGWNGDFFKTFTGIVTSYVTSEKAGMETITLTCEDYMFILGSSQIINSPYYDGMVARFALEDLAKRSGLEGFEIDWESEEEYFLPSSYAWTSPVLKFDDMTMFKDCMITILNYFQAFMYFDGEGILHLNKVPGGMIGNATASDSKDSFYQDPSIGAADHIILDNKDLTVSYADTVNNIFIISTERDTNNIIYHNEPAEENRVLFKKTLYFTQPAFGELAAVQGYSRELGTRAFNPIMDISFKTVGFNSDLMPYDFVTVKDQLFRITSMKRDYNAETNDFSQTFECSWGAP